jgi:hypothetical protein
MNGAPIVIEGRIQFHGSVDFAPERVVVSSATALLKYEAYAYFLLQDLAYDASRAASLTTVYLIISLSFITLDAPSLE